MIRARLPVVLALTMSGCDVTQLRTVDDSDAGPPGARNERDAGLGDEADAGELDGGDGNEPDEDGGVACIVDFDVSPAACELDADFCDAVGDIGRGPSTDIVQGWSRADGDDFVVELQFAAPLFTRGAQEMVLYFRLVGAPRDLLLRCPGHGEDASAALLGEIIQFVDYAPATYTLLDFEGGELVFEDVCSLVAVSDDRRTVQIRVPNIGEVQGWWIESPDGTQCDEPDGIASAAFIAPRAGQQDDGVFRSVCDLECPEPLP